MAFSYSDKNFTVIGNLGFVHIILNGTESMFDIPPAIVDRMLYSPITCTYPYLSRQEAGGGGGSTLKKGIGYAVITNSKISLSDVGRGYLSFYFPIDSNK